jgi:hypothetical protein
MSGNNYCSKSESNLFPTNTSVPNNSLPIITSQAYIHRVGLPSSSLGSNNLLHANVARLNHAEYLIYLLREFNDQALMECSSIQL